MPEGWFRFGIRKTFKSRTTLSTAPPASPKRKISGPSGSELHTALRLSGTRICLTPWLARRRDQEAQSRPWLRGVRRKRRVWRPRPAAESNDASKRLPRRRARLPMADHPTSKHGKETNTVDSNSPKVKVHFTPTDDPHDGPPFVNSPKKKR